MDKLDSYMLTEIFSYVYDLDSYESYARIMWQFGTLNKRFKKWTRRRDFLETFYFHMFPNNTIPANSRHDSTNCVSTNTDDFGYLYYRSYWGGAPRKVGRCRVPSHYDTVNARNVKSRFKNMYVRCRNKYIGVKLKANPFSQYMEERLNFKKRQLDALQNEYSGMARKKQRNIKYKALKDNYF